MTFDERATGTPHSAFVPPRPLNQEAGTPTALSHRWLLVRLAEAAAWVSCSRRSSLAASVLTVPPWRLPLYRQRRKHTAERRALKIELPAIAPDRNHHRPAFDNKAHAAQEGFVENRVHGGLSYRPRCDRPSLPCGALVLAFHLVGVFDSLFPHDHRNTERPVGSQCRWVAAPSVTR